MTTAAYDLGLPVLPPEYRTAFEALQATAARVAGLEEINKRLEHLVAELNHAVHGKKSEKLREDDRQLAFEDLKIALAEVEEHKQQQASGGDKPKRRRVTRRNLGNLPEGLPRTLRVIEPGTLEWSPLPRHWSERQWRRGCGIMHRIGVVLEARLWRDDRTERLDIVPAQCRVIVTVRPKYACRTCTDGVTQAPTPPWLPALAARPG